jgi:nicotinamidase/pyrazinamidase
MGLSAIGYDRYMPTKLTHRDILLVVDLQNDFLPGGALAVPDGDAVVPIANLLGSRFEHVALTQDWHVRGHLSFASSHPGKAPFDTILFPYGPQVLWPDHCVQGTRGAEFAPGLAIPQAELIVRKGYRREIDSYSAFCEVDHLTRTGLAGYLRERGFSRIYLAGLATDFCVAWSALDARSAGFEVVVIEDACRAIDTGGSLAAAWSGMNEAGVERVTSQALVA